MPRDPGLGAGQKKNCKTKKIGILRHQSLDFGMKLTKTLDLKRLIPSKRVLKKKLYHYIDMVLILLLCAITKIIEFCFKYENFDVCFACLAINVYQ